MTLPTIEQKAGAAVARAQDLVDALRFDDAQRRLFAALLGYASVLPRAEARIFAPSVHLPLHVATTVDPERDAAGLAAALALRESGIYVLDHQPGYR